MSWSGAWRMSIGVLVVPLLWVLVSLWRLR
jgi:hypothetical protein